MQIRRLRADDIPTIIDIQTECGLSPWTSEAYEIELHRTDSIMLAALRDATIVGFIVGRAVHEVEAEIYNIGTTSHVRRTGVGSVLVDAFVEECRTRGVSKVWLEVRVGNQAARGFYRSLGFEPVLTRKNFYSNPVEDAIVMASDLSNGTSRQSLKGA